jgi:hypothetical protein
LSDGQEARYKVTFLGPAHNDIANVNRLAQGLKDRFKLSDEAVTKVMKMAPVVIKKGATSSEAQRYKEALEVIGARVQLEPESIEEARGQEQQTTEENSSPLDREPQIIPVKAKTPPPSSETAAPEGQAGPHMTTCPQCGVEQEATDECIKCGVIISKFLKYQAEVKPAEAEGVAPGAAGTPTEGQQSPRMIGTPMAEPTGSTPWEDRAILGFFTAFFRTMKEVLFSPTVFFRRMPANKKILDPFFYGVIISYLAIFVAVLMWQYTVAAFIGSVTPVEGQGDVTFFQTFFRLFQTAFLVIFAVVLPIQIAIGFFIGSGILHICLLMVGAGKNGFKATFRVVAYTSSSLVFALIPFVGGAIVTIYNLVLLTIGFRESHRTTTGRALIAVLLPMIVVLLLIVFAIIIPLILSSGQTMQQEPPSF